LPTYIESEEFEILQNQLKRIPAELFSVTSTFEAEFSEPVVYEIENVVEECYQNDTNSVPSMHRLLPISKIIPDYGSDDLDRQANSRGFWDLVQNRVSSLLREAANLAFQNGLIDEIKRERYFISSIIKIFNFFLIDLIVFKQNELFLSHRERNFRRLTK
jgi:hypothetical protein